MADLTASRLRANIYRILDDVLRTGRPVEIQRRGQRVRITRAGRAGRLQQLVRRAITKGAPEGLVHRDWSKAWKPKIK